MDKKHTYKKGVVFPRIQALSLEPDYDDHSYERMMDDLPQHYGQGHRRAARRREERRRNREAIIDGLTGVRRGWGGKFARKASRKPSRKSSRKAKKSSRKSE